MLKLLYLLFHCWGLKRVCEFQSRIGISGAFISDRYISLLTDVCYLSVKSFGLTGRFRVNYG